MKLQCPVSADRCGSTTEEIQVYCTKMGIKTVSIMRALERIHDRKKQMKKGELGMILSGPANHQNLIPKRGNRKGQTITQPTRKITR